MIVAADSIRHASDLQSLPPCRAAATLSGMKPYRPSIRRLQEEWAMRVARQVMKRRRKPAPPSKITDNSVPWMEDPQSLADYWFIAENVNKCVRQWGPQATISSDT